MAPNVIKVLRVEILLVHISVGVNLDISETVKRVYHEIHAKMVPQDVIKMLNVRTCQAKILCVNVTAALKVMASLVKI